MPDVVTKMYIRENSVFADVVNYFIYGGKQVISPDTLTELDPTELMLTPSTKKKRPQRREIQKYRDVLKYAVIKNDTKAAYIVFGIENQTEIHYAMPVKNMLYDALRYSRQVDAASRKHRQQAKQDKQNLSHSKQEFLSGFQKDDHLIPVITLVILFNSENWNAPKSIHEMMDIDSQHKELLEFVQDYRIHLIEPAALTSADFIKFQSSLREVLEYISSSNDPKKLKALITENPRMEQLDRNAAEVINAVTKTPVKIEEGADKVNMCKAIEEMLKESKNEGMAAGIAAGELNMLIKLVKNSVLNEQIAAEQAGMSPAQFHKEMEIRTTN